MDKRLVFSNSALLTISNGLVKVIAYAYFLLIAKRLSIEELGGYGVLITTYLFLDLFSNLGIDKILIREISQKDNPDPAKWFYSSLFLRLGTTFIFYGLCLSGVYLLYPELLRVYRLAIPLFFLTILPGVVARNLEGYFTAKEKMVFPAISQLMERLGLLLAAMGVFIGLINFKGFLICFLGAGCLRLASLVLFFPPELKKVVLTGWRGNIRPLLKTSSQMLAVEVLALVYFRVDIFLLSKMTDLRWTGIYQFAYKIFDCLIVLFLGFIMAVFPTISAQKEKARLGGMLGIGTAVISVIALVVILLRDWILGMFQPDFLLGSTALMLLLLTLPLVYLTTMLANYAIATNRLRLLVGVAILLVVTNIGLNLLLIPHYGIDGAAAATLLSELVSAVVLTVFFHDRIFPRRFQTVTQL